MKRLFFIIICFTGMTCQAWCEDLAAQVKKPIKKSIQTRQKTQNAEDNWVEEKAKLEAQFNTLQTEHENLLSLKNESSEKIAQHKLRIETLENKIREIARISEELLPYLDAVYEQIVKLVENDLPFLQNERWHRLKKLEEIFHDDQVLASEKFRRIMEALLVEAEYGNTVEVYQEKIALEEKHILADIFRLGKLSLFFRSLDQAVTGYYDPGKSAWNVFPKHFNKTINAAMEIGAKRRSVELLALPVGKVVVK